MSHLVLTGTIIQDMPDSTEAPRDHFVPDAPGAPEKVRRFFTKNKGKKVIIIYMAEQGK